MLFWFESNEAKDKLNEMNQQSHFLNFAKHIIIVLMWILIVSNYEFEFDLCKNER